MHLVKKRINMLHVSTNNIFLWQIYFQCRKIGKMSDFVNLINVWLNEKTIGFAYLLKYSICCNMLFLVEVSEENSASQRELEKERVF